MATQIPTPSELEAKVLEPDVDELVKKCVSELQKGERRVWLFEEYRRAAVDAVIEQFKQKNWKVVYHFDSDAPSDQSTDYLDFEAA